MQTHNDLYGSFVGEELENDKQSHGTFVSGVITANRNELGMVGVAPKCKILNKKVLNDFGEGTEELVAQGIREAVEAHVDIINMSLGASVDLPLVHEAIKMAYDKGIVVVCAAGNSGDIGMLEYPAKYPECISVGALNAQNLRAEFSQTGSCLDFMAPGVDIVSTVPIHEYVQGSGTSFSAPFVSGIIALIISKHRKHGGNTPIKNVEDIREHLKRTAIDIGDVGKDVQHGFGLIDVEKVFATDIRPTPITDQFMAKFGNIPEGLGEDPLWSLEMKISSQTIQVIDVQDDVVALKLFQPADISISEINADPEGKDRQNLTEEWVELQNDGEISTHLTNWRLQDDAGHMYIFPTFALLPKQKVKIRTGIGADTATDLYWNSNRPIWNNTGDTIYLYDTNGTLIIEAVYG